jgi:hypothetical protein
MNSGIEEDDAECRPQHDARKAGALPGAVITRDAVQRGARTGISEAHSWLKYCRQDGRNAPALNDYSTAHNLSDCKQCSFFYRCHCALCPIVQLQAHSFRLHDQPGGSAHLLPSTAEFRAYSTVFNCCDSSTVDRTGSTVQSSVAVTAAHWTGPDRQYCTIALQSAGYEIFIRLEVQIIFFRGQICGQRRFSAAPVELLAVRTGEDCGADNNTTFDRGRRQLSWFSKVLQVLQVLQHHTFN